MKILYAIQGSGYDQIRRAQELIPALMSRAQVDVLISGTNYQVELPFKVKQVFKGIHPVYKKSGRINYFKTLRTNNIFRIIKEIRSCKVQQYDMVINDFEPISAWACYFKSKICVSLDDQLILLKKKRSQHLNSGSKTRDFSDQTQAIVDTILTNHIIATELSNEVFQGL